MKNYRFLSKDLKNIFSVSKISFNFEDFLCKKLAKAKKCKFPKTWHIEAIGQTDRPTDGQTSSKFRPETAKAIDFRPNPTP